MDANNAGTFDPEAYKEQQRAGWSAAAEGWRRWWSTLERGAQPVSDRLVERAGLGPGHKVLDVATGIGEPAVTAARRVRPGGRVVALDLAPGMLAIARERAAALGLSHIEFYEGDAESLELRERDFDAALSRWGLMFLPDLPKALRGIGERLKPGGRLAAAVWGPPEEVPMLSIAMRSLREVLDLPPPPPEMPGPFRLADPRELARTLEDAGFANVTIEPLTIAFEFDSPEAYVRFQQEVSTPVRTVVEEQPPDRQAAVWEAMKAALGPYTTPEGRVRLPNVTLCAVAEWAP